MSKKCAISSGDAEGQPAAVHLPAWDGRLDLSGGASGWDERQRLQHLLSGILSEPA